jgi:hypothetical protein
MQSFGGAAPAADSAGGEPSRQRRAPVLVALPPYSVSESLLSHHADRIPVLEHRYLVSTLLLGRLDRCSLVFVASRHPGEEVLAYSASLVAGEGREVLRRRLHALEVPDSGSRAVGELVASASTVTRRTSALPPPSGCTSRRSVCLLRSRAQFGGLHRPPRASMGHVVAKSQVTLRLQGGLPPMDGVAGTVWEIACDESGFSGANLLDAATPVITHASVDLSVGEAVELIAVLRSELRFSVNELKSGRFLRSPRAAETLRWFVAALAGRAHVHVTDKEYFLVTRIVDLFVAEPSYAAGTRLTESLRPAALMLYRARRSGGSSWDDFLAAFVELVRTKRRPQPDRGVVERFFQARDALARTLDAPAEDVLDGLTRDRVWAVVQRLNRGDRSIPPPLEPMLPALVETVLFWSGGQRQVLVIHDEQSALTADRLRRLQRLLADNAGLPVGDADRAGAPPAVASPLAGLVTVDSRDDPRIQVADLLAGIARASPGKGHPEALEHLLSPTSLHDPSDNDGRSEDQGKRGRDLARRR